MILHRLLISVFLFTALCGASAADEISSALEEAQVLAIRGYQNSAIASYLRISKKYPDDPRVLKALADFMVSNRNYPYALKTYKKYLSLMPSDTEIRWLIIQLYMSLNLPDYALNECKEYLDCEPGNTRIMEFMQDIYMRDQRTKEAMIVTQEIVRRRPDDRKNVRRLVELFYLNGEFEKSLGVLKRYDASLFSPYLAGLIYMSNGLHEKAVNVFNEICSGDPSKENAELLKRAVQAAEKKDCRLDAE